MQKDTPLDKQANLSKNIKKSELKKDDQSKVDNKKNKEKLDPTHFGDWQIDGRTIDF